MRHKTENTAIKYKIGDIVKLEKHCGGSAKIGEIGPIIYIRNTENNEFEVNFPSQEQYLVRNDDISLVKPHKKGDKQMLKQWNNIQKKKQPKKTKKK